MTRDKKFTLENQKIVKYKINKNYLGFYLPKIMSINNLQYYPSWFGSVS